MDEINIKVWPLVLIIILTRFIIFVTEDIAFVFRKKRNKLNVPYHIFFGIPVSYAQWKVALFLYKFNLYTQYLHLAAGVIVINFFFDYQFYVDGYYWSYSFFRNYWIYSIPAYSLVALYSGNKIKK